MVRDSDRADVSGSDVSSSEVPGDVAAGAVVNAPPNQTGAVVVERVDGSDVGSGRRGAHAEDWPWVAEWRAGGEPTPWATGLALAVFSALLVGVAGWVLSAGLSDRPIVAVLVNLLVAGGLLPAMWLSRDLPVLRWIAGGALAGILCGWTAALLMLPAPG